MNLLEVQQKLIAPKDQKNSFGNYNYRSCEDILNALKQLPLINPVILTDELVHIGDRYYVKATATYGVQSVTAYAREAETKKGMDSSQITGSASSYARKYALNGLFAIDDTKDADTQDNRESMVDVRKADPEMITLKAEYIKELNRIKSSMSDKDYDKFKTALSGYERNNQKDKIKAGIKWFKDQLGIV